MIANIEKRRQGHSSPQRLLALTKTPRRHHDGAFSDSPLAPQPFIRYIGGAPYVSLSGCCEQRITRGRVLLPPSSATSGVYADESSCIVFGRSKGCCWPVEQSQPSPTPVRANNPWRGFLFSLALQQTLCYILPDAGSGSMPPSCLLLLSQTCSRRCP